MSSRLKKGTKEWKKLVNTKQPDHMSFAEWQEDNEAISHSFSIRKQELRLDIVQSCERIALAERQRRIEYDTFIANNEREMGA